VGGTDFEDVYNAKELGTPLSTYWNSKNSTYYGSAKSYIPEIPWNQSCAGYLLYHYLGYSVPYGTSGFCNSAGGEASYLSTAGGSGGPSNCAQGKGGPYSDTEDSACTGYAKPSWQAGILGNPSDGWRDIPDVSLFAAAAPWGHAIIACESDKKSGGTPCTGAPSNWSAIGGTSASAPMMAAIQGLVDEKWKIRAGNPNPTYYAIARSEFGTAGNPTCYSINETKEGSACVFHDITQGDNGVDCVWSGTPLFKADCGRPTGVIGVLSTQAIDSLTLKAAGSGYTSAPTCAIAGPSNKSPYFSPAGSVIYAGGKPATCTATINPTTHVVSAVKLTAGGLGYTGVPICTISGGGGKGATCMAVITSTTAPATYQPAFGATPGWDMATGLGSVNAYNLVFDSAW
jgi:hypothetical protein